MRKWCLKEASDDCIYSAIVNATGNYNVKHDIFMSVPVKFDNGEFFFIKNYKFHGQADSILNEIIRVYYYFNLL